MTVFFFFFGKITVFEGWGKDKKKKKKLLDVFVVSHTLTWRSKFKESHWSVSDLTCQISWWGFSSTCFFFFFLRKESLSLLCGWQAQAIYIYISAISLLSSFILLLHFFSISSHLPSTIPSLSVSLPLFFSAGIHFLYIRVPFFFFYFLPLCHLSLSVFPAFSLPCGHAGSFSWSARTL